MPTERSTTDLVLRVAFLIVTVVAGLVGLVMLIDPGSTGDYFSWALGPPPLASLVGGLYVASALVFGLAASRPWGEVRGLVVAVLGLTLPTLVATLAHQEVFDFSRPVAIVWIVLFVGSPLTFGTVLFLRRRARVDPGRPLAAALRVVLAIVAVALVAFALLCWADRPAAASLVPYALAPMGGAFLGAWALFLALLAAWAALRGGWNEARIPLLGLAAYGAGGALAALRSYGELDPSGRAAAYLIGLAAVAGFAANALRSASSWRASTSPVTATPTPTRSRPRSATPS
jgi:hypothetical protein